MKDKKQISACYIVVQDLQQKILLPIVHRENIKNDSKGLSVVVVVICLRFFMFKIHTELGVLATLQATFQKSRIKNKSQHAT